MRVRAVAAVFGLALAGLSSPVRAQTNPVYVDDSASARDTLAQSHELEAAGNLAATVSSLQRLLDREGARLVAAGADPDLFMAVRDAVHRRLLDSPALLERYRATEDATAGLMLDEGRHADAERTRLLTRAGFEAALRVAQRHLEGARFHAAADTLLSLDAHPDRRARAGAREGLRVLALVARYAPRPDVLDALDRWSADAGWEEPPQVAPIAPPARPETRAREALAPGVRVDLAEMPSRALSRADLDPLTPPEPAPARAQPEARSLPPFAQSLWAIPAAAGDMVLVNDGAGVGAWDRYTLSLRWYARPPDERGQDPSAEARRRREIPRIGAQLEDCTYVTIAGRVVLAATGLATEGSRDGDARIHALDLDTGSVLWSLRPASIDPRLSGATARGPIAVAQGVAVVALQRSLASRRQTSVYLAGIDVATGRGAWVLPVGSAGDLPQSRPRAASGAVVGDGIVYRVDRVASGGVATAVEPVTGRPVWVRRLRPAESFAQPRESLWAVNIPVLCRDSVLILAPDRSEILRLSRSTGEVIESRPNPGAEYLVPVGEFVAGVSDRGVTILSREDLGAGLLAVRGPFDAPGLRGRAVPLAENAIALPLADGVIQLDVRNGGVQGFAALEQSGNVLPLGDSLIVVDDARVHAYLGWSVADAVLSARMRASPEDPVPAVTYVELAYHAGRGALVPPAADAALAAIARDPLSPENRQARSRLFQSLLAMVERSQESWAGAPASTAGQAAPALDVAVLGQVLERVDRAAENPAERIAHLVALARLREVEGRFADAVDACQRILADPAFAEETWRGGTVRVRARIAAGRLLDQVLTRAGPAPYAHFDDEARRRFADLPQDATAAEIEAIALAYPAATLTPRLWLTAADREMEAGRHAAAIDALQRGLDAADLTRRIGQPLDDPTVGRIAGSLVAALERAERVFAAARVLRDVSLRYPGLELTDAADHLDAHAAADRLADRLAQLERRPRIGSALDPSVQALPGWTLVRPLSRAGPRSTEHVLLTTREPAPRLGLWSAASAAGGDRLGLLWERPLPSRAPVLLRQEPDAVYLFWREPAGSRIERIDAIDGSTRWMSAPFGGLFPRDPPFEQRVLESSTRPDELRTPLLGTVRLDDPVLVFDERVAVLAERSGRLAAFDTRDGRTLWARTTELDLVHDLDAAGGYVLIAGRVRTGQRGADRHALIALDARTGEPLGQVADAPEPVRWVRVSPSGRALAGLQGSAAAVDLPSGQVQWHAGAPEFVRTLGAWVFADGAFVLDPSLGLSHVRLEDGQVRSIPGHRFAAVPDFTPLGERACFSSPAGLLVVEAGGRIVGVDALGPGPRLLAPEVGADLAVALAAEPAPALRERPTYPLHFLSAQSARLVAPPAELVLEQPPEAIMLLDGLVLVSAGGNTLVYATPAE